MKKKQATLIFHIPLTIFTTEMLKIISFVRRDIAEFVKYGITAEKVDTTVLLIEAHSEIPTDDELVGNQVTTTQAKDANALQVREGIGSIMTRVENKFGADSGIYRKFGISEISSLDGGKLSYTAKRVLRVAKTQLTELTSEGLTEAELTAFKTTIENYDIALGNQEDAFGDRDIATDNRCEKANEIYRIIMKYCDTGKQIWRATNEAKYNDYVIYGTPTAPANTATKAEETDTPATK